MCKKRWFVKIFEINKGVGQLSQYKKGAVNDFEFDADQSDEKQFIDSDVKKNSDH